MKAFLPIFTAVASLSGTVLQSASAHPQMNSLQGDQGPIVYKESVTKETRMLEKDPQSHDQARRHRVFISIDGNARRSNSAGNFASFGRGV